MTHKLALCLALVLTTVTGSAQAAAPAAAPVATATASANAEPVDLDVALAGGDLGAARSLAEAERKARPSAASWAAEAEVCERQADLACARTARAQQRDLMQAGSPERAAVEAKLAALEDMSRGTVEDEPASTHRGELDQARSSRELALRPAPKVDRPPLKKPPPRERIVKKWYFWVTMIAIAASGAAITAIAVKAAADEQPDDLTPSGGRIRLDQGFGIRF